MIEYCLQSNLLLHFIQACLILLFTAAVDFIVRKIIKKTASIAEKNVWAITFLETLKRFSFWVIWGVGILFSLEMFFPIDALPQARKIFIIIAVAWAISFFKNRFEQLLLKRSPKIFKDPNNRALLLVGNRISSIAIITITGLIVLDIFGVPLATLLAFGGLGGLAVSWAAKDVIANFFGGLMIYINRPFIIGDWIKSPNKSFEGVVENIGWYMTQIRTFERRPTYIPNAVITDAVIENPGRMYNRRIRTTIGLRYEDIGVTENVIEEIREMLSAHPEIDHKQFLMVHLLDFGASSLDIEIYAFTVTTKWHHYRDIQQDVLLKIAEIVAKHGAEIAFPTTTIHLEKE